MKLAVIILFVAVVLEVVASLPFPFELGGDRDDFDYRPRRRYPVYSRGYGYGGGSSYRRPYMSRYANDDDDDTFNSKNDDEDDEDRKNREKVEKAIAAQQMVVNTVLPLVHSIVPGLGGMMPRMRRSSDIPADLEDGDQLSLPSETSLLMVPVAPRLEPQQTAESDTPEKVPYTVLMPMRAPFPSPEMVAQERNDDDGPEEPPFSVPSERGPREAVEKITPMARSTEGFLRSLPSLLPSLTAQLIPPSLIPPSPHATIQSGNDDKIYFAVDRKTILDFLSALFGGEMRSALAAAVHENSVLHSRKPQ